MPQGYFFQETMNYIEIETWLINTIPGIILLGAIGSIVGSIFLWMFIKIVKAFSAFFIEKTDEIVWKFLFNLIVGYARAYFRARDLVNILSSRADALPISMLYAKVQRKATFYSLAALISFFISLLLFILLGTEYVKTSIFFVACTFIYTHDAIILSIFIKLIEDIYLREDEESIKKLHLNKYDVFKEAQLLFDKWYEGWEKKKEKQVG